MNKIESILANSYSQNRETLYEHEVYAVLSHLGFYVPKHSLVSSSKEITHELLHSFGSAKVVLKVVTPEVAHKRKAGGVVFAYKDLEFIRYSFEKLRKNFADRNIKVPHILITEYIEYDKDLGNEILLGFRESESFGPVISFSKGGNDAEHFAANFSPPNIVLPPISKEWALTLLQSTKIYEKYCAEGNQEYINTIVDANERFSRLSTSFSNFFPGPTSFAIHEFEINPFIFDDEGRLIALDGYASFGKKDSDPVNLSVQNKETLRPFFEPQGIAVVGVSSSDPMKAGNIIAENMLDLGRDDIYCVNPNGGTAAEFSMFKNIIDISEHVDLAIITVPAEAVLSVVKDCTEKDIRALLLIPGGFSETGEKRNLENSILETAKKHSMRIMGPNCLGIISAGTKKQKGINTFFIPKEKFTINFEREQNVVLLSQSGAMGLMEIDNLKNAISPKVIVSYGNQLDIDPSDLVQYFEKDRSIDVIGLYIEGFNKGAGRKFFDITKKTKTPIIVYKAGRTEEGQRATRSHTASISGEYAAAKASMKQAGLIVADSVMDHADFIKTFALLHNVMVKGNRVAVVANAGYEKTYAADNIMDMELATLDPKTEQDLRKILPSFVTVDPLLDLTPMVSDEEYEKSIDCILASENVDALCISIVPHAQLIHTTDQEIEEYKENIAARIVRTVQEHKKPVTVSVSVLGGPDAVYNKLITVLEEGGVPTFISAGRAMFCLNEFIKYHLVRKSGHFSEWLKD